MARKKRIWYPGATYHVMSRGNRRGAIFKDHADYIDFLECLRNVMSKYTFYIHSLCLMTNHFHIIIETGDEEIWKIMHRLLLSFAADYNRKYHITGHVFETRYNACLIEDERYFLEVSRYIHLNPVKAQMVREPLAYEYSSYGLFVNDDGIESNVSENNNKPTIKVPEMIKELVQTRRVLDAFRHNSRGQYRMFVEGKISHLEQEMLIQKDMKEDDMWLPW